MPQLYARFAACRHVRWCTALGCSCTAVYGVHALCYMAMYGRVQHACLNEILAARVDMRGSHTWVYDQSAAVYPH